MSAAVRKAQIDLLLGQINFTGLTNIVSVSLTSLVLWSAFAPGPILAWLAGGYGVIGLRQWWLTRLSRRASSDKDYRHLARVLMLMVAASGLVWGAGALLFLDDRNTEIFIFFSLALAGMGSAALPPFSAYRPLYFCFIIPLLGCAIVKYFLIGYWALGLLGAVYTLGLIYLSLNLHRIILQSILTDQENIALLGEVTAAKEAAERANLAKSQFLAAASHDLRQPLQAMGLLLDALAQRLGASPHRPILDQIVNAHRSLDDLFNALLELSRLDAGAVQPALSHQPLAPLLDALVSECQAAADAKGIAIVRQWPDAVVHTDPVLLSRILRNILSNAVKYTDRGSVTVTASADASGVDLSIADTGIGMAPDQLGEIFEEYRQLDNAARDRDRGLGLGLAVVRRMADLLGLDVRVTSTPGAGSTFTVRLPPGDPAGVRATDEDLAGNPLSGRHVLVLDNDPAVLSAMGLMLDDWHCPALTAASPRQARDALAETGIRPDIIICDYRLADGATGIEAIAALRGQLGAKVPAVIISGDLDPAIVERIHQSGLYLLHKPVRGAQLQNVMRQLLADADDA